MTEEHIGVFTQDGTEIDKRGGNQFRELINYITAIRGTKKHILVYELHKISGREVT